MIRRETEKDDKEFFDLIKAAFESAEHKDGNEQDLAEALRKSDAFVPELSLVAEISGKIAGHIMYSKAQIDAETVLVLAPLSVAPEFQRSGVGTALITESKKIAKALGWQYIFVLGSEKYYPKAGYSPAEGFGIKAPFDVPSENFMACILNETGAEIHGTITYAPEFGIE